MASSIIDKKLPRRGCRAEHRATDSRLRTRRKRSSLIPEQLSLSSRYVLKRSKIDISQDVKCVSGCFGAVGLLRMFLRFWLTTADWLTEEINLSQINQFVAASTDNGFEHEHPEAVVLFQRVRLSARLPRSLPLTSWQIHAHVSPRFQRR